MDDAERVREVVDDADAVRAAEIVVDDVDDAEKVRVSSAVGD